MKEETQKMTLVEEEKEDIPITANAYSFSNYIDQSTITPFKTFLQANIKSFNLLPNEENSNKENELENSLKIKYNFDTPILEIVLKVTSDYDKIQEKLKEYLDLFGEINSIKYDHNANTVKINYKYYFSCLYANRSLTNIIQKPIEINSAIQVTIIVIKVLILHYPKIKLAMSKMMIKASIKPLNSSLKTIKLVINLNLNLYTKRKMMKIAPKILLNLWNPKPKESLKMGQILMREEFSAQNWNRLKTKKMLI